MRFSVPTVLGMSIYEITIRGRLPNNWEYWFDGFAATSSPSPKGAVTTLVGPVIDQAQLHGLLAALRDLGLPIERVLHLVE